MNSGRKVPPGLVSAPLISDWVKPDGAGFALRTGRAELGQGVQSAMLRIASWELGVPVERLTITGPDTGASPDEGMTAGSLSITQGGQALRAATSALRVLCLSAAAQRLNTSPDGLSVSDGVVHDAGRATGLELADLAAAIDLDQAVLDFSSPLGQPDDAEQSQRPDLRARIVGAPFVHDMSGADMVFGRVFPPPCPRAHLSQECAARLHALASRDGIISVVREGDFLGLVATHQAAADAAAAWLEPRLVWEGVDTEPKDPHRLLAQSDAPTEVISAPADVAELPQDAPSIDLTFMRPPLSHGPIAPSAAVAKWHDGEVSVWSHSQGVYPLRRAIAKALDLPEAAVRVIHTNGSGCYGHNGADDAAMDAVILARAVPGRAVRLIWSRSAEFQSAPLGAPMTTRVRLWMQGARIKAAHVGVTSAPHSTRPGSAGAPFLRAATLLPGGAPFPPPSDLPAARGHGAARNAQPIYDAPALVERKLVVDLPWRTSALRGLGAQLNVYGIETALEAAFIAQGVDPFEGRLANLSDPRARAVLERLRQDGADLMVSDGETQGWGIALARYKGLGAWAGVLAQVEMGDILRVPRVCVVADMGEVVDPDGARNQIEGGVVQSVSWALKEAITLEGSRIATDGWEDYPILSFSEAPQVRTVLIDRPLDPPLGCAEAVVGPASAAVGNGVQRLLGVPVRRLPLTRHEIVAAISEA